jgi:hypothetical protein
VDARIGFQLRRIAKDIPSIGEQTRDGPAAGRMSVEKATSRRKDAIVLANGTSSLGIGWIFRLKSIIFPGDFSTAQSAISETS